MPSWLMPGLEAQVEVGVDDLAGDVADVLVADARVVLALRGREARRSGIRAAGRPGRGSTPARSRTRCPGSSGIVARLLLGCGVPSGSSTSHMTSTPFSRAGSGKRSDRLEHAVRAPALGLARRAAVEAPQGELLEGREGAELLHLRLAAQVRDRLVAVEPDVFELVLAHQDLPHPHRPSVEGDLMRFDNLLLRRAHPRRGPCSGRTDEIFVPLKTKRPKDHAKGP